MHRYIEEELVDSLFVYCYNHTDDYKNRITLGIHHIRQDFHEYVHKWGPSVLEPHHGEKCITCGVASGFPNLPHHDSVMVLILQQYNHNEAQTNQDDSPISNC